MKWSLKIILFLMAVLVCSPQSAFGNNWFIANKGTAQKIKKQKKNKKKKEN